eukprot:COSAG02_NODE_3602_length_6498_cov_2.647914_5_plen_85_part_00
MQQCINRVLPCARPTSTVHVEYDILFDMVAKAISKEGERPPATKWVLGIIREIHAVGIEAYDPQKDGRSAKRKPRKTARPQPPK